MRVGLGRRIVVAATGAALAAGAVGLPAATSAAAERTESFTVLLSPSDRAGFDALVSARGLARHDRASFLRQVAPTSSTRSTVLQRLSALGLNVSTSGSWVVTASGPASVVDALLGDRAGQRRAQAAAARAGRAVARTSSVPALLSGLATAVAGGNDTRPVAHPLAAQTGASLRALYHSTTGAPSSGHQALTVATLQLSGWDASALTSYASLHGLADPVASGQYVGIPVGGASVSTPDGNDGDVEVALDQEALLAVAPQVRQRAYVAANSTDGFFQGILKAANDTATVPGLAALSISWGGCEADWGSDMAVVDAAIKQAVAAGVTVFAASGDSGNADCTTPGGAPLVGVDFPASDPLVVAVGGTTVTGPSSETAWSGSGGGTSSFWAHPEWQSGTARRQVPDIATDANPSTGLVIYARNSHCTSQLGANQCQVGGTSLASPIAAGTFVATLASAGLDGGVGDIHAALYSAPASSFRDITAGSNGFAAGPGYDRVTGLGSPLWDQLSPQLRLPLAATVAQSGPAWSRVLDVPITVTPSGSVAYATWGAGAGGTVPACPTITSGTVPTSVTVAGDGVSWIWVAGRTAAGRCDVARVLVRVDRVRPTVTAKIGLTTGRSNSVTASWRGADALALDHYMVVVTHAGSKVPDLSYTTTRGSTSFVGRPGYTYTVTATAYDKAGNRSKPAAAKAAVPLDDRAFTLRTWRQVSDPTSFGGSYSLTSSTSSSAVRTVSGRSYTALFTTCASCGRANIYVGRTLVRTVDLYSPTTRPRVPFAVSSYGTTASRTITVRPTGRKSPRSHGVQVRFDAVVATS
jgi:hypothetical protein